MFTVRDHDQRENMTTLGGRIFPGSWAINLKLIFNLLPFLYGDLTLYDAVTTAVFFTSLSHI